MIRFVAVLLCLFLVVPTQADEQPKKPRRIFDRKLIIAGLTMLAGEIADNETTLAVLRRNSHAHEANPFYGSHPSRLRVYSIGTALTGLSFLTAVAAKQQAIKQNRPDGKLWLLPVVMHDGFRAFAAWHNSRIPARQPTILTVCPAAGGGCP